MKKIKFLLLASSFLLFPLTGCGVDTGEDNTSSKNNESSEALSSVETSSQNNDDVRIHQIYELYKANGGNLSYEQWLNTIKGEKGDKGDAGSSLLTGVGAPYSSLGKAGDSYIDTSNWSYYNKNGSNWSYIGSLISGSSQTNNPQGLQFFLRNDDTYFVGCGSSIYLSNLVIPSEYNGKPVTGICEYGFSPMFDGDVRAYESIVLPNTIKTISYYGFGSCEHLTNITLSSQLQVIGDYAFADCELLANITLPASLQSIGRDVFRDTKLTSITYNGTQAQWESIEKSPNWIDDSNIVSIVCSDGVIEIDDDALTVGLICIHGDYAKYDKRFIDSMKAARNHLGFNLIIKEDILESSTCYDAATVLVEQGCDIIFADSFGHEPYMIQAAKENPDTLFCSLGGVNGAGQNLNNFGNAYASIYEGRFLTGIAAGLKLAELYGEGIGTNVSNENAKVGFVGAFTYAEVLSSYTAFYLGVKSIVPNATMEVKFVGSWYDETTERNIADELIMRGAKIISQYSDSYGAVNACEQRGVPNVTYNGSTFQEAPSTYLATSYIDWQPIFEHVINNYTYAVEHDLTPSIENDYVGTLANGAVKVEVPSGIDDIISSRESDLIAGNLHVFDANTFTIGEVTPTEETVKPGIYTWENPGEVEFLLNGYYHESDYRSAPSLDFEIDGITVLNRSY